MQSGQSMPHLNTASVFDGRTASTGASRAGSASSMPIQSSTSRCRKPGGHVGGIAGHAVGEHRLRHGLQLAEQVRPRRARLEIVRGRVAGTRRLPQRRRHPRRAHEPGHAAAPERSGTTLRSHGAGSIRRTVDSTVQTPSRYV